MKAKLVVVGGDAKATEINLKLPSTVGRGREASLTLPHPLVSRLHCELYDSDGRLFVRDLGSLNGTFINNERIDGEAELPEGELLTIGTVTFRAEYEEQAEMRPPKITEDPVDETVNVPVDGTVAVPSSNTAEERVTAEQSGSQQLDGELDDEDFDGFDDLDFEELDELGEDEEYHQEADQANASETGPTASAPQPLNVQAAQTVPDADSLPAPAPPVPSATVPAAQPAGVPAMPTATPMPPARSGTLPSPTPAQAGPVSPAQAIGPPAQAIGPPAQAIGPPAQTENEAGVDSGDDDLNSFLKGLK